MYTCAYSRYDLAFVSYFVFLFPGVVAWRGGVSDF